eukprot:jgi/Mesvir1/28817/Mv18802-RA.1
MLDVTFSQVSHQTPFRDYLPRPAKPPLKTDPAPLPADCACHVPHPLRLYQGQENTPLSFSSALTTFLRQPAFYQEMALPIAQMASLRATPAPAVCPASHPEARVLPRPASQPIGTPCMHKALSREVTCMVRRRGAEGAKECEACKGSGKHVCATCQGSGLYTEPCLESKGVVKKVTCIWANWHKLQ